MTGRLDETICYLIGGIDNAADQGTGWRVDLKSLCKQNELKIKFLDPTNKVTGLQEEVGKEHAKVMDLKQTGQWEQLSKKMKEIVRQDQRCVDLSDFVIFYLDPDIHTCGSYFELQCALAQKKPYFLIVPGGKERAPSWLFGILDHMNIYGSAEDVVRHLVDLNNGRIALSSRWVIFREQIKGL